MKNQFTAVRLRQAPSLSSTLVAKLREEIGSNRLQVGDRFPSDAEIANAYGVSRTVVREAVSALRAEGLVNTQRGRGSIVASRVPSQRFGISQEEVDSLDDVLKVYELRSALESEAAALAAVRRDPKDIEAISACLKRSDRAVAMGEDAIQEDIDLHLAIATATHNDYFPRLLGSFSSLFIARRRVRSDLKEPEKLKAYLDLVQSQHHEIVEAISRSDATTAAAVMRRHLDGSRYRSLRDKELGAKEPGGT
jgi:DNA-binding FadR family transcriptional regulator